MNKFNDVPVDLLHLCKKWYFLYGKNGSTPNRKMWIEYYDSKVYTELSHLGEFYRTMKEFGIINHIYGCFTFTDEFIEYLGDVSTK